MNYFTFGKKSERKVVNGRKGDERKRWWPVTVMLTTKRAEVMSKNKDRERREKEREREVEKKEKRQKH